MVKRDLVALAKSKYGVEIDVSLPVAEIRDTVKGLESGE